MSLDLSRRIALSRHADLKVRSEGDILVLPEQAIRLGGSGGEILRLVIEGGTGESVLAAMRDRYPEQGAIDTEVRSFLGRMFEIRGIVHLDSLRSTTR